MDTVVKKFIDAKNKLNSNFECEEDFFIRPLINCRWTVKNNDGVFFLSYFDENDNLKDCVIVKKDNKPMIFERENYTMIVAIECVKLAFILNNNENF